MFLNMEVEEQRDLLREMIKEVEEQLWELRAKNKALCKAMELLLQHNYTKHMRRADVVKAQDALE